MKVTKQQQIPRLLIITEEAFRINIVLLKFQRMQKNKLLQFHNKKFLVEILNSCHMHLIYIKKSSCVSMQKLTSSRLFFFFFFFLINFVVLL